MDFGGSISRIGARTMPLTAILQYELRGLASSWLVRLWLIASALLTLLTIASGWGRLPSSILIASLLFPYLVFPWFLVVMLLGISPVTGARLDTLVDGILCRPITRYEYLLACWAARVLVVLGGFLLVMVPSAIVLGTARRSVEGDSTWYGMAAALLAVALVLVLMVSLGFLVGTLVRRPLVAAVVLIFAWFPLNQVLHVFSLEEFSTVSLNQALPTLLRTPWRQTEDRPTGNRTEDMEAMAREAAKFLSAFSGAPQTDPGTTPKFYRQGEYGDFSLTRVLLGYGIPTLVAVGLSLLAFCWRDL
jgi:ABC-type transport system involved in multi-copper enzyme maturation permease subunit